MTSVTCIGIAVRDFVFQVDALPDGAGKFYAQDFQEVTGGVAANAAIAVARLGGKAQFIGRVGDDGVGSSILADMEAVGVGTDGVLLMEGTSSPMSTILVDQNGERTIVNHTSPTLFVGGDTASAAQLNGADAVLVDVRWPDGALRALEAAASKGIPSVFDYDRPMPDRGAELLAKASHVAFSQSALEVTAKTSDPGVGLAAMAEHTDAWLAVTLGGEGVVWRDDGSTCHLPAFEVDVVDTAGAGDVFHGALALALAEGQSEASAVRFAAAAAALKCTRRGAGRGAPQRAEVETLLKE